MAEWLEDGATKEPCARGTSGCESGPAVVAERRIDGARKEPCARGAVEWVGEGEERDRWAGNLFSSFAGGNPPVAARSPKNTDRRERETRRCLLLQAERDRVRAKIDGADEVEAHGPRIMPVWGRTLRPSPDSDSESDQEVAARQIDHLVAYLSSIQDHTDR